MIKSMDTRRQRTGWISSAAGALPAFLVIVGTVTSEGVGCLAVRGDDGTLYTLMGVKERPPVGSQVEIEADVARMSTCQQGTALMVKSLKVLKPKE